ncbi:Zinc finger protein [Plakobranchus ocellatus]|uniref:Zinc finger protein n=1 Tax=Plakobranchus ocellatus TaxID=259542 RepID=A0AAV4CSF3_9GAST|nr:Zinc finger protein [Plakobranchus ocellatus]
MRRNVFGHRYVQDLEDKVKESGDIASRNAAQELKRHREMRNKTAVVREYKRGDKVLILLPKDGNNLYIRDAIKQEMQQMLDTGIIRPSSSPFASPITVVRKKDGTIRLCIDFRRLNSVTVFDAEPILTLDEILAQLTESKVFTKIDLCKAPTFQKVMRMAVRHLPHVASYFDDILIHRASWEDHLLDLEATLQALRQHNLTGKPKVFVGFTSIEFLGHIVGVVRPDEAKTEDS